MMNKILIVSLLILVGNSLAEGPWNGHAAAFSFSTDDGYKDNIGWAEVFHEFDYNFTIFVVTDKIGSSNRLDWNDIYYLDSLGNEIGSHSVSHKRLLKDSAFVVSYIGDAAACSLSIFNDTLFLRSSDFVEDTQFYLEDSSVFYLVDLVSAINGLESFACSLIYYPDRINPPCKSDNLIETSWVNIKNSPYLALTSSGVSMDTLLYETIHSKELLTQMIRMVDSTYKCVSFAYPYHSHELRTMIVLRDSAGYLSARDGSKNRPKPWGGKDGRSNWDTVTLYEVPIDAILIEIVGPNNSFPEETTRVRIRAKIQEWKTNHVWANFYSHVFNDTWEPLDTLHLRWILDEITRDGDIWVAPFGVIAEYVRKTHFCVDGWHWVSHPPIKRIEKDSIFSLVKVLTPYNPSEFRLPFFFTNSSVIKVELFDSVGRLIRCFRKRPRNGRIFFTWDGRNRSNRLVRSGVYFLTLSNGSQRMAMKMLLLVKN